MNKVTFQLVLQFTALTCSRRQRRWSELKMKLNLSWKTTSSFSCNIHLSDNISVFQRWCKEQESNSSHLFAAGVVQQLDVTGMKRLPCVYWHQHHFVSNHHLEPSERQSNPNLRPKNFKQFSSGAYRRYRCVHAWGVSNVIPLVWKEGCYVQQRQANPRGTG